MRELGITQIFARSTAGEGVSAWNVPPSRDVPGPVGDRTQRRLGLHHRRGPGPCSSVSCRASTPASGSRQPPSARPAPRPPGLPPARPQQVHALPDSFVRPHEDGAVVFYPRDTSGTAPALPLASILASPATTRSSTAGARSSCCPGPSGPATPGRRSRWWNGRRGELSVLHQGETIASREAPPRAGVLRAARSELARNPDHERIASGLGSGGAPRRLPVAPAVPAAEGAPNGAAVKPEPANKQLRAPTPRQLARWKAIQQAQLQGLSMRATARLLGIARDTVSSYVRANGVPGRRNGVPASSNRRGDTDEVAAPLH